MNGGNKIKKYTYLKFWSLLIKFIFLSYPTFSNINKTLVEKYEEKIPMRINVNIKNNEAQPIYLNYVFIKTVDASIREDASINAKEIVKFPFNTKLKVLEKVKANGNEWYKVELTNTDDIKKLGYISSLLVTFRSFRFEEMDARIKILSNFLKSEFENNKKLGSINTYKPNPNNKNMNRIKDKYGTSADQNAKALYKDEIIYIPDRTVLSIEFESGNDLYVNAPNIPENPLKVNKNLISRYPFINPNFRKVIVIDLDNENQGIFEKTSEDNWELISYTLNKTGLESTLGFETPKGYFIVPMVKYEMGFRDDFNTSGGIAKYAIRFSGGGYIHGTPINFEEEINRDFFLQEKDSTLGTIEGTRKCIRNTEAHIKFLFDWVTNGKVNRKSNEQKPDENVMVIIF